MRTKKLHFEESMGFIPGVEDSIEGLDTGRLRLRGGKLLRAAIKVALREELTPRQRECVTLYFMEQLTMDQISERLGIRKSTVHKHIQAGKEHIRRVLAYAQAFQEAMDEEDEED